MKNLVMVLSFFAASMGAMAQNFVPTYQEKEVFKNSDVVFRQIDQHTWEGNGHLMANESLYLIEGDSTAILLDAGTKIPGLRAIVENICHKPVRLIATHVHPDHTGSAVNEWEEIWINAADMVSVKAMMPTYKGTIKYLTDGEIIKLGGREIEVIFTPGHTPGSCTFVDKTKKYGFSGDSFGSGNLLIITNLTTVINSCQKMSYFMDKYGINYLYPGHYMGKNVETPTRVKDIAELCLDIRSGKKAGVKGKAGIGGLDHVLSERGVRLNYSTAGVR